MLQLGNATFIIAENDKVPVKNGASNGGRQNAKQRYDQLLACAMKVFAERGLEAANHALIASEAGVSVPLCYFYFRSREALVDVVLCEVENLYKAAFDLAEQSNLPAHQALKLTSDALISTLDNPRYGSRIFIDWSIAVRAVYWPRFLRLHRHLVGVLTRVITRGQQQGYFRSDLNPEDEAEMLHASSFALAQLRMSGAGPQRIERFRKSMMRRLLNENNEQSSAIQNS